MLPKDKPIFLSPYHSLLPPERGTKHQLHQLPYIYTHSFFPPPHSRGKTRANCFSYPRNHQKWENNRLRDVELEEKYFPRSTWSPSCRAALIAAYALAILGVSRLCSHHRLPCRHHCPDTWGIKGSWGATAGGHSTLRAKGADVYSSLAP